MSRACGILLVLVLVTGNILCGQEPISAASARRWADGTRLGARV